MVGSTSCARGTGAGRQRQDSARRLLCSQGQRAVPSRVPGAQCTVADGSAGFGLQPLPLRPVLWKDKEVGAYSLQCQGPHSWARRGDISLCSRAPVSAPTLQASELPTLH